MLRLGACPADSCSPLRLRARVCVFCLRRGANWSDGALQRVELSSQELRSWFSRLVCYSSSHLTPPQLMSSFCMIKLSHFLVVSPQFLVRWLSMLLLWALSSDPICKMVESSPYLLDLFYVVVGVKWKIQRHSTGGGGFKWLRLPLRWVMLCISIWTGFE